MATYFEARACKQSNSPNFIGGYYTITSMAIADYVMIHYLQTVFRLLFLRKRKYVQKHWKILLKQIHIFQVLVLKAVVSQQPMRFIMDLQLSMKHISVIMVRKWLLVP